jgi:5-methylcytosine-specific restriction endonuclease McrA
MTDFTPTSRKRKVSAVKDEATRLHSQIVRLTKGPYCQEGCGRLATDAAHIIPRVFAHTRTDIANAYALAAECHRRFTNHADEWMAFVDRTIGRDEYLRLKMKAQVGVAVKFDWFAELDRLRQVWAELQREAA